MLTARENMIATIEKDGKPDRAVNMYEAVRLHLHPAFVQGAAPVKGGPMVRNAWGVWNAFPDNTPGPFPVHDKEHTLIKDIEHWQDYVHAPTTDFSDEEWAPWVEAINTVDTEKAFKAVFVLPGVFEQCHNFGEISATLMNLYEYPDEMHDLIKYITEYEPKVAEGICSHLKPDCLFHHDDWGTRISTFMSPAMFEEFFVEPYKEIYGYYHKHGCRYVIHHSDSYAATLVPAMIDMGIDVWQGCFSTNNIPELTAKYGGKITFMGGIENSLVDYEDWTRENIRKVIRKTMEECGGKYFIPCIAEGAPGSTYPGVYQCMSDEIDAYNFDVYGFTQQEQAACRMPVKLGAG